MREYISYSRSYITEERSSEEAESPKSSCSVGREIHQLVNRHAYLAGIFILQLLG